MRGIPVNAVLALVLIALLIARQLSLLSNATFRLGRSSAPGAVDDVPTPTEIIVLKNSTVNSNVNVPTTEKVLLKNSTVDHNNVTERNVTRPRPGTEHMFPLTNDKTIPWSTDVHRVWLDPKITERPAPAQLMITNFGWNGEDHDLGLRFIRTKRSRELLQGVMNHPWFDPTAFEDYNAGRRIMDNVTRFYVFLDIETCYERNYPMYAHGGLETNSDQEYDRGRFKGRRRHCDALRKALRSQAMRNMAGAKIIFFDCAGNGPQNCASRQETQSPRVVLASISAHESQHYRHLDQGLPPPAPKAVELTEQQERDIELCNETTRPYLLTFAGRDTRELRHRLFDLHNGKDVIIEQKPQGLNMPEYLGANNYSYTGLLAQSKFAAIPRGDNLFSYRFTEALSAGSIPVVYADQWVLPFRKSLVDWADCCAVIIPEGQVKSTIPTLRKISDEKRCRMRKQGYEVYRRYMKTGEGVVAGLIEGLENEMQNRPYRST